MYSTLFSFSINSKRIANPDLDLNPNLYKNNSYYMNLNIKICVIYHYILNV